MAEEVYGAPATPVIKRPVQFETENTHAPAANTAAQIMYSANGVAGRHIIEYVAWSYDDTPTGGNLMIHDGAGHVFFQVDITAGGPGFIPFAPESCAPGTALVITLAAGGGSVSGKVNVIGHRRI